MYSTCLFCAGSLGRNDVIERLPVGRRVAFDPSKGRLWVVCPRCARWNLTPFEERWEALEEHTAEEVMTRWLCTLPPETTLRGAASSRPEFMRTEFAGTSEMTSASGCSICGTWPACATVAMRAPGTSGRTKLSTQPTKVQVLSLPMMAESIRMLCRLSSGSAMRYASSGPRCMPRR